MTVQPKIKSEDSEPWIEPAMGCLARHVLWAALLVLTASESFLSNEDDVNDVTSSNQTCSLRYFEITA
jgi:hypothetical protein